MSNNVENQTTIADSDRRSGPIPQWAAEALGRRAAQGRIAERVAKNLALRRSRNQHSLNSVDIVEPDLPTDSDHEKAAAALAELKRRRAGWKLHLNFDPDNPQVAERVVGFLHQASPAIGSGFSFKVGRNGGQTGKEATIYAGSKDDAERVAAVVESGLGDVLLRPEGDAAADDAIFTAKVAGRFDIGGYDHDFHQYGKAGVPFMDEDMRRAQLARVGGPAFSADDAVANADYLLTQRYGSFYTGSKSEGGLTF